MLGGLVEEWHIPQVSMLLIATTDHRVTELSPSGSLGSVSWVQKATP